MNYSFGSYGITGYTLSTVLHVWSQATQSEHAASSLCLQLHTSKCSRMLTSALMLSLVFLPGSYVLTLYLVTACEPS